MDAALVNSGGAGLCPLQSHSLGSFSHPSPEAHLCFLSLHHHYRLSLYSLGSSNEICTPKCCQALVCTWPSGVRSEPRSPLRSLECSCWDVRSLPELRVRITTRLEEGEARQGTQLQTAAIQAKRERPCWSSRICCSLPGEALRQAETLEKAELGHQRKS